MHEDFYRAPLDLAVTEDATDAVALQVAEPNAGDVNEEGEESQPVEVAYTEQNLSRYEDPIEEITEIVVEEAPALVQSTRDSHGARAFKVVLCELLTRRNHSKISTVRSGSLPSVADFTADVYLAAKRSLAPSLYRLFSDAVESEFEEWHSVSPEDRRTIMHTVGTALIERGVCDKYGRTRAYFFSGYKQRGFALAKAA